MRYGFTLKCRADGATELSLFGSTGSAPMGRPALTSWARDPQTETVAVLLGRLFYREEAAAALPMREYPSDAALALAVYQHAGREGLARLEGEFALAIWDGRQRCLWATRDPLGSWPLFWRAQESAVTVSTTLSALTAGGSPEFAMEYLADFLMRPAALNEPPGELTALAGVQRIPAGFVQFDAAGTVTSRHAWDWASQSATPSATSLDEAGQQFVHLLRQSVQQRMQGLPTVAHLSGGMDSSAIVCAARDWIASGSAQGPLHTLSLVYQRPSLAGERKYIDLMVQQAGPVAAHYLEADNTLGYDWFPDKIPLHDEPYSGLPGLALEASLVEGADQAGAAVSLSGQGSDQILFGEAYHIADLLRRWRWIAAVREAAVWSHARNQGLWATLRHSGLEPLWPVLMRDGLWSVLRGGVAHWPHLSWFSIPSWIPRDFARHHQLRQRGVDYARQRYRRPAARSMHLQAVACCVGDWGRWSLAAPRGLQISHPFVDVRLIRFCLGLSQTLRSIPGERKPVLQTGLKGVLPEAIRVRRDKRGFDDVYWRGLAVNLPHLERMVQNSRLPELGVLNREKVLEALRQAAVGIGDIIACDRLSKALALIAWADQAARAHTPVEPTENHCWGGTPESVCVSR